MKKRFSLYILDHKTNSWLLFNRYNTKREYEIEVNKLLQYGIIYALDEYMIHDRNMEIS
ncbi:MAG: hypothetical protein PHY08_14210 [Candidatus Cloacimonetes bacterium]|nr:hypothetical protein [Candidatus Cloacimonadota bacterium]